MFKLKRLVLDYPTMGYILCANRKFGNEMPREMLRILNDGGFYQECLQIAVTSDGINFSKMHANDSWALLLIRSLSSEEITERQYDDEGVIFRINSEEEVVDINLIEGENQTQEGEGEGELEYFGLKIEVGICNKVTNEFVYLDCFLSNYDTSYTTPQPKYFC